MSALLLSLALSAPLAAEEIGVSVGGKARDAVESYKVGSTYYLSAQQAAAIYGCQVYWYPVSGRLQMSARGKSLQFLVGSDEVSGLTEPVKLDAAVMLRTSHAFIPMTFFLSEEFSAFAGVESVFNARTKFLSVERRSTVGSVRWFSYNDATRLTVELDKSLSYKSTSRGVGGVEFVFPFGSIASNENAQIEDGILGYYALNQRSNAVALAVKLEDSKVHWRVKEVAEPRRLVIDFYRGELPSLPAVETHPVAAPTVVAPAPKKEEEEAQSAPETAAPTSPSQGPVIVGGKDDKVRRRIVVDAGHGGKDPGASGYHGTAEKDFNLLAAQELAKLLAQEKTFEVMLTRNDDTFVPLADRSRLANEFGADLFISLHCNASRKRQDEGFEVYFQSETSSDPEAQKVADLENSSIELEGKTTQDAQAEMILGELSKTEFINASSEWAALLARDIGKRVDVENHGVKQAGFYVLRGTHAPAVLFEMAYITNKSDEAKLESKKIRRKIVDGVYAGILDYAKREGWMARPD